MGWDRHEINELLASPNIGSYHPPGQIRLCSSSRLVSFFAVPGPLVLATPCVPPKVLWDCGLCALVGQPVAEPAGLLCTHQSGGMCIGGRNPSVRVSDSTFPMMIYIGPEGIYDHTIQLTLQLNEPGTIWCVQSDYAFRQEVFLWSLSVQCD